MTKCRPVFRVAGNSLNNCLQGDDEKKEGEEKEDEEEEESEEEESEEESEEEEGEEGVKVAYCYKISEFWLQWSLDSDISDDLSKPRCITRPVCA